MGYVEWNVGDGYWARIDDAGFSVELYERCDGECDRTLPRSDGRTIRSRGYTAGDVIDDDILWLCYACYPDPRHTEKLGKPRTSR